MQTYISRITCTIEGAYPDYKIVNIIINKQRLNLNFNYCNSFSESDTHIPIGDISSIKNNTNTRITVDVEYTGEDLDEKYKYGRGWLVLDSQYFRSHLLYRYINQKIIINTITTKEVLTKTVAMRFDIHYPIIGDAILYLRDDDTSYFSYIPPDLAKYMQELPNMQVYVFL